MSFIDMLQHIDPNDSRVEAIIQMSKTEYDHFVNLRNLLQFTLNDELVQEPSEFPMWPMCLVSPAMISSTVDPKDVGLVLTQGIDALTYYIELYESMDDSGKLLELQLQSKRKRLEDDNWQP